MPVPFAREGTRRLSERTLGARNDRSEATGCVQHVTSPPEVDEQARELALTKYALPLGLHIPIAARDKQAIKRFVGRIEKVLTRSGESSALVIHTYDLQPPDDRLPIWEQPGAAVLRQTVQVWVHVNERRYRAAYITAFPDQNIENLVIDHVMNRRVARLKGFDYLRVVPISRAANSSSGGLSEKWGFAHHSTIEMVAKNQINQAHIQYADLADIVKMLDIKTGGSLQEAVNEAQAWVSPRG